MLNKNCTINTKDHTIVAGQCLSIEIAGEIANYIIEDDVEYEIDCKCVHLFEKDKTHTISYYDHCQDPCS